MVVLGGFGFIVFQIYQFLFNVGGSRSKVAKDKAELKQLAKEITQQLAPLTKEELSLLSSKLKSSRITKGMYYTEKGLMMSIFEEPLVSYGYRNYGRGKSLLVANTANGLFEFEEKKEGVHLSINGFNQGIIDSSGELYDKQGNKIAELDFKTNDDYRDLKIGNNKVGSLLDPENEKITDNTRAYLELKDLDEHERNLVLAITMYDSLIRE